MFTGIIQSAGEVRKVEHRSNDLRLHIALGDLDDTIRTGDSIAVNGLCLTAIARPSPLLVVDVSRESLDRSCIGDWNAGTAVNLEKALTLSTPLGGHLVSGHVDGIGVLESIEKVARSQKLIFSVAATLGKYIAEKGSITVDGISLTVNEVVDRKSGTQGPRCLFAVNIVPHTLSNTTMTLYQTGRKVHIEVDLLARYLERLMSTVGEKNKSSIDLELLKRSGFLA